MPELKLFLMRLIPKKKNTSPQLHNKNHLTYTKQEWKLLSTCLHTKQQPLVTVLEVTPATFTPYWETPRSQENMSVREAGTRGVSDPVRLQTVQIYGR